VAWTSIATMPHHAKPVVAQAAVHPFTSASTCGKYRGPVERSPRP
jgi:hypothetical protein